MASEAVNLDWFGGDNASAFVGTDAGDSQNDSAVDLGLSGFDDAFGTLGGKGAILGFTAETDGGVADDFSLNPETPGAAGSTAVVSAGDDTLFEDFDAVGDESTLGLDDTSGASDMFGGVAFDAADTTADDVLEETPTSEAAETPGIANPFVEADYEHEVIKCKLHASQTWKYCLFVPQHRLLPAKICHPRG